MVGGGGIGKEKEGTEETQTSDQPTSLTVLYLSPVPAVKSDRGSAYSGSLNTRSYTNWDSDQRKSCSSAVSSARQDTSTQSTARERTG